MKRRTFLTGVGVLLTAPLGAEAQDARRMARIGYLGNGDAKGATKDRQAFREGLRALGWVENQTITIEYRWAEGKPERLPSLAAELVRLKSDVLLVSGSAAVQAAQNATNSVPVVIAAILVDPVNAGFVASLARPGGNITGLASQYEEIVTKQVQLLSEAVPGLSSVGIFQDVSGGVSRAAGQTTAASAAAAADKLGLTALVVKVNELGELARAFTTARNGSVQAILVLPSPFFHLHRHQLISLAASYRLPAVYELEDYVQGGGLMSYGVSIPDMYRRAARYVDRILKGSLPGDLPIERPDKFQLMINLKTAKALGLTIPPSLLLRADEVIQ